MADLKFGKYSDGVRIVELNRAPVNALVPEFMAEIEATFEALAGDPGVRAVVIRSAFKVFSAGIDLRAVQSLDVAGETRLVDALNSCFLTLYEFPKPLVASVNGPAIAGGLFFALAADFTIASEFAKFGLSEVRVGASFPVTPLEIARAELTPQGLRHLMLRGHPVDAETALRLGAVDEVAPHDAHFVRACNAARDMAEAPAETYAAVKAQIRAPAIGVIRAAIEGGTDPTRNGWFTADTKAAMAAALER